MCIILINILFCIRVHTLLILYIIFGVIHQYYICIHIIQILFYIILYIIFRMLKQIVLTDTSKILAQLAATTTSFTKSLVSKLLI
jgi:hypothetical protein